ncbi:MAG TPA: dTMP kinase [Bacteroidota bacterium]|nr:dTMP kinase [Bacteroidota bacterium]
MFITFEGIDYSGKSTQAKLVADRLASAGRKVMLLREPGGTELSERIRALLLDRDAVPIDPLSELMLFSAARAQLVREVILPALREGTIVVCDRFYDSTTAYQGYGRNLPLDEIRTLNRLCTAGTTPDLTLFVDVDPDEIKQRKIRAGLKPDRMERSGDVFFRMVVDGYRRIARDEPDRLAVVPGHGPIAQIHEEIWKHVERKLSGTRSTS